MNIFSGVGAAKALAIEECIGRRRKIAISRKGQVQDTIEVDRTVGGHSIGVGTVDGEVADVCAYLNSFISLYSQYIFVESDFSNGIYKINAMNGSEVVEEIELSERLGSIFLSSPSLVLITETNKSVMTGMKYVDGITWTF